MPRVHTLPKSGTPQSKLPHSLHVPEVAEFNTKGVFQLPLVYHVHVYVGSIVPFEPSLHIDYASKNLVISHDLVSTWKLGFGCIRCKYSCTELIRKWSIFRVS